MQKPILHIVLSCKRAAIIGFAFVVISVSTTQAQDNLFLPAATYSAGGIFAGGVAVADLNRDGKPDIVVANGYDGDQYGDSSVGVLLGNGDGTFQPAVTYTTGAVGSFAYSVAIADINLDGKLDIVVTDICNDSFCKSGHVVAVLYGNGDGTFRKPIKYHSGGQAWAVAVADLNHDGLPDLVVANLNGSVGVLLGTGKGHFKKPVSYRVNGGGNYSLTIGDFDRDGKLDVAVTSFCADKTCSTFGLVNVLLGNGDGTFQPVVSYSTGGRANDVATLDVNHDGVLDLIVANGGSANYAVLLGNGDGTFQSATTYSLPGYAVTATSADVNQDGIADLLFVTGDYDVVDNVTVLLGNSDGTFQAPSSYSTLEYGSSGIAVADVNGDGTPDLVVGNQCTSSTCSAGGVAGTVSVLIHTNN